MLPAKRLIQVSALCALIAVPVGFYPELNYLLYYAVIALVVLSTIDIIGLLTSKRLVIKRVVRSPIPVGEWSPVELHISNPGSKSLQIVITDYYPEFCQQQGLGESLRVPGKKLTVFTYSVKPSARGNFQFNAVQYRQRGFFGLWMRSIKIVEPHAIRVFPDFAKVAAYEMLVHQQRQGMMGVKKIRRRGQGMEFEQLREYRMGDMLRQIDWNATSRHHKLISREYQTERDQRIIFLLDCSRRMLTHEEGLGHFDQTLNAALLLSYVALKQGDSIGLMTFSGEKRWFAPRKGAATVNQLLNATYDIQPGFREADYNEAAQLLLSREKKRALVIILTNLRDEDSDELLPAIHLLKQRHVVLVASMKEELLRANVNEKLTTQNQALEYIALEQYKAYRDRLFQKLHALGVSLLDVSPTDLSVALVNSYFKLKSELAL